MEGMLDSGPGINALPIPESTMNATANHAGKRHRRDGARPVGKSSGTKMTRSPLIGIQSQPEVSQAIARKAGQDPCPRVSARSAYTDPAKLKVISSPTRLKTHPKAFLGWRETTSPTRTERGSAHKIGRRKSVVFSYPSAAHLAMTRRPTPNTADSPAAAQA